MKILVVDDSIEKASLIQRILTKKLPYDTVISDSAESAFRLLGFEDSHSVSDFKIILMDVSMPGMDGISATKLLKNSEKFKDIPILMITSSNDEETIDAAFRAGAMDYINTTPIRELELLARVNSAIRLYNELERRKRREEKLLEKTKLLNKTNKILEKISVHDPLTNLYNRRYFDKILESEWDKVPNGLNELCLLMVDLDYFKLYNDQYGHQAGDLALKKVADILKKSARRGRDLAARYGGEEFAVILSDTKLDGAVWVAGNILRAVQELEIKHIASPHNQILTCSIGVAGISGKDSLGLHPGDLISRADKALYDAKKTGRNRIVKYEN